MSLKNSEKFTQVSVSIEDSKLKILGALADLDENINLGEQIRRAVKEYIDSRASELKDRKVVGAREVNVRKRVIQMKPSSKE